MPTSGSDIKRAHYHKRLFDMVMADVDHTKGQAERHEEACSIMEQLLGKGWEAQANPGGIEVMTVEMKADDKLNKAGDKYGLGPAPDKDVDKTKTKERIVRTLKELLDNL